MSATDSFGTTALELPLNFLESGIKVGWFSFKHFLWISLFDFQLSRHITVLLCTGVTFILLVTYVFHLLIWSGIPLILWINVSWSWWKQQQHSAPKEMYVAHRTPLVCRHHVSFITLTYLSLRLSFRWGIRFTGCNHHPLSVGSKHPFSGGSDSLQSPQEQRKNAEHRSSFNTWYKLQNLCIHKESRAHFVLCLRAMPGVNLISARFWTGQQGAPLTAASFSTSKVQAALCAWEIPEECVVEGLEFWQTGRYGPICKGLLKKRDATSSAVVVKSLRGTDFVYQRD